MLQAHHSGRVLQPSSSHESPRLHRMGDRIDVNQYISNLDVNTSNRPPTGETRQSATKHSIGPRPMTVRVSTTFPAEFQSQLRRENTVITKPDTLKSRNQQNPYPLLPPIDPAQSSKYSSGSKISSVTAPNEHGVPVLPTPRRCIVSPSPRLDTVLEEGVRSTARCNAFSTNEMRKNMNDVHMRAGQSFYSNKEQSDDEEQPIPSAHPSHLKSHQPSISNHTNTVDYDDDDWLSEDEAQPYQDNYSPSTHLACKQSEKPQYVRNPQVTIPFSQTRVQTTTSSQPKETTSTRSPSPIVTKTPSNPQIQSSDRVPSTMQIYLETLIQTHTVTIPINAVISELIEAIWRQVDFSQEKYSKASHILLLFNHRLHIFLEYVKNELVSEFIKINSHSISKDGPHFYIYAIQRDQQSEMYTYHISDGRTTNIFDESDWWKPIHFNNCVQSARPQSILLSSLYALQLYFREKNTAYTGINQSRESQFFFQLRTYMFPPAVLAFKHAMLGSLFWFEKPLIVDAVLALLNEKCSKEIKRTELGDCVPLLLCWLLSKCNTSDILSEENPYPEVDLTYEAKNSESSYFYDPVTTSRSDGRSIQLIEKVKVSAVPSSKILRHIDIGSLTRYLTKPVNYYSYVHCKSTEYCIYNPSVCEVTQCTSLSNWSQKEIENLYKSMNTICPNFSFIAKGAISANVHDQLALLQDCNVVLVIEQKKKRSSSNKDSIDHLFYTYNPIAEKKRTWIKEDNLYNPQVDTKSGTKSSLPVYLSQNICTYADSLGIPDLSASQPTTQITVVLLDRSRSMSEKIVASDTGIKCTNADMSTIMLGILSDNIVSARQSHAFGLIHFATSVVVQCPITRNRDRFEKALSDQTEMRDDWTSMYDAIKKATLLIAEYVTNEKGNIAPHCKKLIICISDGIDNFGPTKFKALCDRMKQYKDIVIDFISFDVALDEKEWEKVSRFRDLCRSTHGYIYKNLPLSSIQLGAMFEQDAAVWVSERDSRQYGLVEKPTRKMPSQLYRRATHKMPSTSGPVADSARYKRLWKEVNKFLKANMKGVSLFITDDINFWKVLLNGPSNTPYVGGLWLLYVQFGDDYPSLPPDVRFFTNIFHVNISGDGKVCHEILNRAWSIEVSMVQVFENIVSLLKEPNFEDAVSVEKAHLYDENKNQYFREAEYWTQMYANRSREDLEKEFHLVDENEAGAE